MCPSFRWRHSDQEAVVATSRWYKCDLQVATPAWKFKLPADRSFDFRDRSQQAAFADLYMEKLRERSIDVIALADHQSAEWLDVMREAGERAGITVFPGVEVTTASGSDGVHLVLIGDLDVHKHDIDAMLTHACGFNADYPRLNPQGDPAPSPKSLNSILDALDDRWFVLAPHALGDNGIASGDTQEGGVRWNALHHPRLSALDPGSGTCGHPDDLGGSSFNTKFRQRRLTHFPALRRIAFINTSDGYSLDAIGTRFSWIRMAKPSLEALRQAALDYEARILGHLDPRLVANPDPNKVQHPWIESITIGGKIGNSIEPITIDLDPRLNVLIGGRGAGKSTAIFGFRHLYGSVDDLPESVRTDAQKFSEQVLGGAQIESVHHLSVSGERQYATWTRTAGALTRRGDALLPTVFPVRVFNQKELFERTSNDKEDPQSASRYLLELVDAELGLDFTPQEDPAGWIARVTMAENRVAQAVSGLREIQLIAGGIPNLRATQRELEDKVNAFGAPETQKERRRTEEIVKQNKALARHTTDLRDRIEVMRRAVLKAFDGIALDLPGTDENSALSEHYVELRVVHTTLVGAVTAAADRAITDLDSASKAQRTGRWAQEAADAEATILAFQQYLDSLGIPPDAYLGLREQLEALHQELTHAEARLATLPELEKDLTAAWQQLDDLFADRRTKRIAMLHAIETRAETLHFDVRPHGNAHSWLRAARNLLNLRGETYADDVKTIADWLWDCDSAELQQRLALWRSALYTNDYETVREQVPCRATWWKKLREMDDVVRTRLASLLADDVVTMLFLRTGADPRNASAWQPVTTGSAGQRSAAMLSFVLNYGTEPLILDQPEDDLDTALITKLVVPQIRRSRWSRQLVIVTHNANIPVNGDAEQVVVLENDGAAIRVRSTTDPDTGAEIAHAGPIEVGPVREDIQEILEGGKEAFRARERRYNNDMSTLHDAQRELQTKGQ